MRCIVIDDSQSSLLALSEAVGDVFDGAVEAWIRPMDAIARCELVQFDIVMVDYEMPVLNGIDVIKYLRTHDAYRDVPMIMVTSCSDPEARIAALKAGVTEFINKPIDKIELRLRVTNLLALRRAQQALADRAVHLEQLVDETLARLGSSEQEIILRLSKALAYRDGDTGNHVSRVARISEIIAGEMGLPPERCHLIAVASLLHDIGKVAVPDSILTKPGSLTQEEWAITCRHTTMGASILADGSCDLVRLAAIICESHHEKWDGTGYPHGLSGKDIPLEARIVAVGDVLDALCSPRPYKAAWPLEEAYREVLAGSGSHFDPDCVAALERKWPEISQLFHEDTGETSHRSCPPVAEAYSSSRRSVQ